MQVAVVKNRPLPRSRVPRGRMIHVLSRKSRTESKKCANCRGFAKYALGFLRGCGAVPAWLCGPGLGLCGSRVSVGLRVVVREGNTQVFLVGFWWRRCLGGSDGAKSWGKAWVSGVVKNLKIFTFL